MALRYLLDTNVVSEWVKPVPDEAVVRRLTRHQGACAIAATTLHELTFGFARLPPGRRRDQLEGWLTGLADRLPILPFDAQAAWWLGVERARLARSGIVLPLADGEIAAVAVQSSPTLVTRNVRDFEAVEELKVQNWHSLAGDT